MNIISILEENGYEIITEIGMKYFKLKFNHNELEKKQKSSQKGTIYDYDLSSIFNVKVGEVGFNDNGNLYICLDCIGGEDSRLKEGDCFDVIEYK